MTNFPSIPALKSDEVGVSGLAMAPDGKDLIATAAYRDEKSGLLSNRIIRLVSEPGGKKLTKVETILDLKQFTAPSNQIQQVLVGADSKLYVSVGDAENHNLSLDLDKFGGKVIRMELDGTACEENPYYDLSRPEAPRSYVYASGIRNAFDMDFHPTTHRLYAVDNGKNLDRLFEVVRGGVYGWNGNYESGRINALFTWGPIKNVAPTGICILDKPVLGAGTSGRCYVACYGPPAEVGANQSKSVLEFDIDPKTGLLTRMPATLLQYAGETKATTLGLAEGSDGLYITDFWGETDSFDDAKGRILKLVPSKATLNLPDVSEEELAGLSPVKRGEVHFTRNCATCHTIDGVGGREGPELTLVHRNLTERLNSSGYLASLAELQQSKESFAVEQRPRIEEVLKASGQDRLKRWLVHHLEEPRFDNHFAKMPSFAQALKPEQRDDVIAFLLTRN